MSIQEKYNNYKEQLELLTENMDKYQFLIDLGSKGTMPEEYRIETFKVPGCMSQVWLVPKFETIYYHLWQIQTHTLLKVLQL